MHFSKPIALYSTKSKYSHIQKFINHLEGWKTQDRIQIVTKDSKCITNVWNNLIEGGGEMGPKAKETVHVRVLWLIKTFPTGVQVNHSETTICYTGIEQLSKWMANGGSQISHYCTGRLQMSKGNHLKWCMWWWVRFGDISMNSGLT